jgi:hypothetical protein
VGNVTEAIREIERAAVLDAEALKREPGSLRLRRMRVYALRHLAETNASATIPGLENWAEGVVQGRAALAACQELLASDPNEATMRMHLTGILLDLAHSVLLSGQGTGLEEARQAIEAWRWVASNDKITLADKQLLRHSLREMVPILGRANPAEGLALAREIVEGTRKFLAAGKTNAEDQWSLAEALMTAARAAGGEEGRRMLAEAAAVAKPLEAAAGREILLAMWASDLCRAVGGDCAVAAKKEADLWRGLANTGEYPAMRLRRAEESAKACGTPLSKR